MEKLFKTIDKKTFNSKGFLENNEQEIILEVSYEKAHQARLYNKVVLNAQYKDEIYNYVNSKGFGYYDASLREGWQVVINGYYIPLKGAGRLYREIDGTKDNFVRVEDRGIFIKDEWYSFVGNVKVNVVNYGKEQPKTTAKTEVTALDTYKEYFKAYFKHFSKHFPYNTFYIVEDCFYDPSKIVKITVKNCKVEVTLVAKDLMSSHKIAAILSTLDSEDAITVLDIDCPSTIKEYFCLDMALLTSRTFNKGLFRVLELV